MSRPLEVKREYVGPILFVAQLALLAVGFLLGRLTA